LVIIVLLSGTGISIYRKLHPKTLLENLIEGAGRIFFRGTDTMDLWPYFTGVLALGTLMYLYGFKKIGKLF
ncbi:MAG: hypothetical protein B5M52_05435, partial [Helicobacteraceae bacterium 4484_230]